MIEGRNDMGRHERRAQKSEGRAGRVKSFRQGAGKGGFLTSLFGADEVRSEHAAAIRNWYFEEQVRRPTCFACRAQFGSARRPGGFLCATAVRAGPKAGVAVAGVCLECWATKTPDEIEAAALALLRRQLGAGRFADDDP
jgi:hypothetical protein